MHAPTPLRRILRKGGGKEDAVRESIYFDEIDHDAKAEGKDSGSEGDKEPAVRCRLGHRPGAEPACTVICMLTWLGAGNPNPNPNP